MGAKLYGVLRTTPFTGVTRPSGWASISVRPAVVRRQRGTLLPRLLLSWVFDSWHLVLQTVCSWDSAASFFAASPLPPRF